MAFLRSHIPEVGSSNLPSPMLRQMAPQRRKSLRGFSMDVLHLAFQNRISSFWCDSCAELAKAPIGVFSIIDAITRLDRLYGMEQNGSMKMAWCNLIVDRMAEEA